MKKQLNIILIFIFTSPLYLISALTISPNYYDISVKPGELYQRTYKILNQGKENVMVNIFMNDRWIKLMRGSDFVMGDPDWVWFSTNTFSLKPSEERFVNCYIQVMGKNITNAEYLQMISVDETSVSPVTGRISVPMYLGIEGKYKPEVKILEWNYKKNKDDSIQFFVILSNSGNTRLLPKVELSIYNDKKRLLERWNKELQASLAPHKLYQFDFNAFTSWSLYLDCELKVDYSKYKLNKNEVIKKRFELK